MIVAVHQPQYLPWLGYFDKIEKADVFVLLDCVQYKKNEWQNRNKIKTAAGWQWLTVPVTYSFPQLINEVGINNREKWQHRQEQAIITNYRKAPHWNILEDFLKELFSREWQTISQVNIFVVKRLAEISGIKTPLHVASDLGKLPEDPDGRLIAIAKYFSADTYLAGMGGREYMELDKFDREGIGVIFQKYVHPVYNQIFGDFAPFMSVIDLIFNHGIDSLKIIRGDS
jgi:hypothetical protein